MNVLKLLFSFKGRINGYQYLMGFALLMTIFLIIIGIYISIPISFIALLAAGFLIWSSLCLISKRMHDTKVTILGFILLFLLGLIGLVLPFVTSDKSDNRHGEYKKATSRQRILGVLSGVIFFVGLIAFKFLLAIVNS